MVKPMPGDMVLHVKGQCAIKPGSCGVIEGVVGRYDDEYLVVFNFYPPFFGKSGGTSGDEISSASGGPALFLESRLMKKTDSTMDVTCWRWDGLPMAGGGDYYKRTARVWLYQDGKK